ncbi:MAG: 1,4-dihydroxy-6-naphthoate synthase [Fibrobacteres bacterium]|nr:1,4-dihydroxy-6-naphthoate synthase [Fibrobacterota bacterium]
MKLRAAISPCPNDVFIFAGLIGGGTSAPGLEFEFAFHDLETLNRDAQAGAWDLAKISYANHAYCAEEYRLLGCGGALGRGCGPLLLSNRKGAEAARWNPEEAVLVPGKHTTANFLLDFYAREGSAAPLRKIFLPFDELYRRLLGPEPCQGVVIHEMRFTFAADGLHLVRDLGEFWEKATGYPIPLGAVALRKGLETARPGLGETVEAAIRDSLAWSYAYPEAALELCRFHSQSMADEVLKAHIDLYVNSFTRDIGPEGQSAVDFFLAQQRRFESNF